MPGMSPESKLEIISNLEKNNIQDVDYQEIIDNMESILEKNAPISVSNKDYGSFDYKSLRDMSPQNIQNFYHDNYEMLGDFGISSDNIDGFLTGINESDILPYKAYKHKTDDGYKWGFYKNIDRYEKASGYGNKPVYLRYYNDGTYDTLDEETFNKEKYFNYLPNEVKRKSTTLIDESSMDETQKNIMYNKIADYQMR